MRSFLIAILISAAISNSYQPISACPAMVYSGTKSTGKSERRSNKIKKSIVSRKDKTPAKIRDAQA